MRTSEFRVQAADNGKALLEFLAERLGCSKKKAKAFLDARDVFVNRRRTWMAHHELRTNDVVEVSASAPEPGHSNRISILFEDNYYVVVDKKPGMLSNGEHSVEELLRKRLDLPGLVAAHRLDRDTSGCLLLAKNSRAFEHILPVFRNRLIRKTYHAIVSGNLSPPAQKLTTPVKGKRAVTHVRTLDSSRVASHLLVNIETGRTHQIRRHLASAGAPVIGDRYYATRLPVKERSRRVGRQMLHASALDFVHPKTNQRVKVKAPLPKDFRTCLVAFGLS